MITTGTSIDIPHDLTSLPGPERSTQSDLDQPTNPPPCSQPPITDLSLSAFERRIAGASLPPPGPSHYAARRQLWLAKTSASSPPPVPSTSRQRLEQLLSIPGAATNEEVWKSGVERVWKGLVTGGRLKRRLPMTLVVRVVYSIPCALSLTCFTLKDQDNTRWMVEGSRYMACRCGCPRAR